jgi:acetyl-CoA carboxylase carboxyl transferase subunit alpha
MKLAEKFERPIITIIDTPGAYPGIDAEERGQAEAIAYNLREMASLKVPVISIVLGEGGSGGALAIGIADRVIMMENAVYSVISPEGCASILWKDSAQADKAAACLRLTAGELKKFDIVDDIVAEPDTWTVAESESDSGNFDAVGQDLKRCLLKHLNELSKLSREGLLNGRYQKFRKMGYWV